MRTLTKILLMVGLALTMSTSAGAMITLGLTQVGGTYSASVGAQAGDTLALRIDWAVGTGDTLYALAVSLEFNGSVQSFSPDAYGSPPGLSTENLYAATFAGPSGPPASKRDMNYVAYGDIKVSPLNPQLAIGWEKAAGPGLYVIGPCTAGAFNSCNELGVAWFTLTGDPGVIAIGGIGQTFGSGVVDGTYIDVMSDPTRVDYQTNGVFTVVPEPTTASLLGLGLLGLTVAGRRRTK